MAFPQLDPPDGGIIVLVTRQYDRSFRRRLANKLQELRDSNEGRLRADVVYQKKAVIVTDPAWN